MLDTEKSLKTFEVSEKQLQNTETKLNLQPHTDML